MDNGYVNTNLVASIRLLFEDDESDFLGGLILGQIFTEILEFSVLVVSQDLEFGSGWYHALGYLVENRLGRLYGGSAGSGRQRIRGGYDLELLAVRENDVPGGDVTKLLVVDSGLSQGDLELFKEQVLVRGGALALGHGRLLGLVDDLYLGLGLARGDRLVLLGLDQRQQVLGYTLVILDSLLAGLLNGLLGRGVLLLVGRDGPQEDVILRLGDLPGRRRGGQQHRTLGCGWRRGSGRRGGQ